MDQTALKLRRLKLVVKHRQRELMSGLHQGYFGTPGFDYKGPRNFVPGRDKPSAVDWHNSRRRGRLIAKEMEPEIGLRLGLILDLNSGMNASAVANKRDTALRAFATLAYAGVEEGNRAGALIAATEEVHVSQAGGSAHGDILVEAAMSCFAPEGTPHRLHHGLTAYPAIFPLHGAAVVMSDLRSPRWREELAVLAASDSVSEVMVIQIVGLREEELTPGSKLVNWGSPITGRTRALDGSNDERLEAYRKVNAAFMRDTAEAITQAGASHLILRTDEVQEDEKLVTVIEQFLHSRKRGKGGRNVQVA